MDAIRLAGRHVVLLGIGHTNAHVVRMWRMQAMADADLTCISDFPVATYSGRLPAVLAGQVPPQKMEIDLVRLCASVGARLLTDRVTGLDHTRQEILFDTRPPVAYDALSIGIGSVPSVENLVVEGSSLLKIKPMQTFLRRLTEAVQSARHRRSSCPDKTLRIVIVGSGVAGIEILFCLTSFLEKHSSDSVHLHLITRSEFVLPEATQATRRRVQAEIAARGHSVTLGRSIVQVTPQHVKLDNGQTLESDVVIWATGASAPPALSHLGLPQDERGFLTTDHTLRSTSGQPVFAVGDSGTIVGEDLAKAGVYAVRQGPILWENIRRTLNGQELQRYSPQRSFLKLINLGDGRAIGQWKSLSFSGRWVMRLKESIDQKFMDKFEPASMTDAAAPMQCRGCGCKLGAGTLAAVVGPDAPAGIPLEDSVEIGGHLETPLLASTDFFSSPVEDAYLAGRITAIHSASDIIASGANLTEALANVVLPSGDHRNQQRMLSDFLAGARHEFSLLGGRIVGGHTIVGPRMEAGFTVIGRAIGTQLLRKGNLQTGDRLFLTKELGIGVLLAAQMRGRCAASDYQRLIAVMLQSQRPIATVAVSLGLSACTDVTGFGLAGHLLEMLGASRRTARIELDAVPILPGSTETVDAGIESSLMPENLSAEAQITATSDVKKCSKYRLLFDPQTCGGLLLGVPQSLESQFIEAVLSTGAPRPYRIGEVLAEACGQRPLRIE